MRSFLTGLLFLSLLFSANSKNIVVTGRPASIAVIQQAIKNSLGGSFYILDDQKATLSDKERHYEYNVRPLAIGEWQTLAVPVPGLTKPMVITLNVYNQPVPQREADFLVVSNEPEKIKKLGLLSSFELRTEQTARFLYYHKNGTGQKIAVALLAENIGAEKSKLHLISVPSGSNADGIYAGHNVTKKFLNRWKTNEGYVLNLEPGQSLVLFWTWVRPEEITAGFCQFQLMTKGVVRFRLVAQDQETSGLAHLLTTNVEENKNRISGIFGMPQNSKKYQLNLAWPQELRLRFGDEPFIVDHQTGRKLLGNYGLFYSYDLELTNNTDSDKIVELYFKPNGGVARGTFLINDILRDTELVGAEKDFIGKKFYTLRVSARNVSRVRLLTVPEPGSNYPVTILLKTKD